MAYLAHAISLVELEDGWMRKLLQIDSDALALILGELSNQGNITTKHINDGRIKLPSFCTAKWVEISSKFGLPHQPVVHNFERLITPVYHLPPSFHLASFQSAWCAQDVYRERAEQTREEARCRILDPVSRHCVNMLAI